MYLVSTGKSGTVLVIENCVVIEVHNTHAGSLGQIEVGAGGSIDRSIAMPVLAAVVYDIFIDRHRPFGWVDRVNDDALLGDVVDNVVVYGNVVHGIAVAGGHRRGM